MSEARSIQTPDEKPELTKYELLEEIGHGGMATVYRALDRRLGREVAVKVIHKHLRESGEVATRFTSEARAVAKLRHPNIVDVYDVSDPDEAERYLVVELVRGTTLRKLVHTETKLPAEIAAAVTLEVAAALEHAHQHGVVHRDVKPENVLVEVARGGSDSEQLEQAADRARVKITDFGIAKLLDAQGVTSTGQVLGSPAHMAPEQIEGDSVTARADVFALGVLMYECMVGALPFDGRNPAQVLRKVLEGTHPAADRARPSVGAGWTRVLERALQRKPEDRYESSAKFAAAIRAELSLLGFERPREQLAEFLEGSSAYWEKYRAWIVDRLVELGRKARADRDVQFAAACFNRALAFRPDDPELVRIVTGLAHAERIRRTLMRGAAVMTLAVVVAGAVFGASRALRAWGIWGDASPDAEGAARAGNERASGPAVAAGPAPGDSVGAAVDPAGSALVVAGPRRPKVRVPVKAPRERRKVRVNITGAKGGKLTVDGVPRAWFGQTHDLTVGQTYVFEFVPPDRECCVGTSKTVAIPKGEGVFSVQGNIAFKDAVLSAASLPQGGYASCGLFGGVKAPGSLSVKMQQAELTISCKVTTLDSEPRTIPATLRPGRTTVLSW